MEPEGSLPHLQETATCPYPEPAQSSPCPIPLLEDPFQYYPPIYAWVSRVFSYLQVSLKQFHSYGCTIRMLAATKKWPRHLE
jgi:hypothetical protein